MNAPRAQDHLSPRSATGTLLRWSTAATLAGALVLVAPSTAHAYRPFDGTDAEVADVGEFEAEVGAAYTARRGDFAQLAAPALVLNLGIWRRLELVLETNNVIFQRPTGGATDQLAETHLFLKAILRPGFLQEKTGPSIAVEAGPWLPNPNGDVGVGGSADFIFSMQLQRMIVHVNLQGAYDLAHHVQLLGTVIGEGPKSLVVRPVTELAAQHAFGGATSYSALFGGIWRAHKSLDVDLGLRAVTADRVLMGQVRLGFTWRATVWHPKG